MSFINRVIIVTGNENKRREIKKIFNDEELVLEGGIHMISLDIPEIQGSAEEVSLAKITEAVRALMRRAEDISQALVVTEDTSLEFECLNGLPGPYIKQFLDKLGTKGLPRLLEGFENKKATARTVLGIWSRGAVFTLEGNTEGLLVKPRGEFEFGWDPNFEPFGSGGFTYAEMSREGKQAISHRSKAMAKLINHIKALNV